MTQCSANNEKRIKMFFNFRQREKNLVKGKKKMWNFIKSKDWEYCNFSEPHRNPTRMYYILKHVDKQLR